MSTINTPNPITDEHLQIAYNVAKTKGYKVYTYLSNDKLPTTWFYIEDKQGDIGYIQHAFPGGISMNTVHKGNINTGTGFACLGYMQSLYGDEIEKRIHECLAFAPEWVNSRDLKTVVKYKSFTEYKSTPLNRTRTYVEI